MTLQYSFQRSVRELPLCSRVKLNIVLVGLSSGDWSLYSTRDQVPHDLQQCKLSLRTLCQSTQLLFLQPLATLMRLNNGVS